MKKITCITMATMVALITIITVFAGGGMVFAATFETTAFEKSPVMEDLQSSSDFDITDYPYDSTGAIKHPQILTVVEYCYSPRTSQRTNYGLYIYFYNPQGLNISTTAYSNKIMLGVKYGKNNNGETIVTDYEKFDLQFCNKSAGDYRNLFYKFKLIDHKSAYDNKTVAERVNSNARHYDISEIELLIHGDRTATAYGVGGSYIFTGYAKGYGVDENAESTLSCQVSDLETVTLNVKHTFYRTETSSKGTGFQNQIDTVYFSVPKQLLDTYGTLQKIKAEWYEYKTNDIIVTSNDSFYGAAYPYIGLPTGTVDKFGMPAYNADIGYSLGQNAGDWGGGLNGASWGWNLGNGYLHPACLKLFYLFNVDNISEYDPYADIVNMGGVESNVLYEWIKGYNKSYDNGKLPIKNGEISADLFASDIDDYRKTDNIFGKIQNGYSYYDFDADVDLQHLSSWQESDPTFWDNWINWGLWNTIWGNIPIEESRTVSPIYMLEDSDLNGTNAEISDRLLINFSDVAAIRNFATTAKSNDEVVFLFRFATTDYYSAPVDIMQLGQGILGMDKHIKGEAYRAWESVFFDFDIIQLTFSKADNYTVLPVVSSPIDIVNSITPPVDMDDLEWWKMLIALLALILVVVLLAPLLPYIFKAIIWVILLPFRAIAALVKAIGNAGNKDETNTKKRGK